MKQTGEELEANRAILDAGIQDQEQWAQKVQGYMRGPPKPESMSGAAPILIQLKQWRGNKCVRWQIALAENMQKKIRNVSILQTCPPSSTAGQQSGASAAAGHDSAQKCTMVTPPSKLTAQSEQMQQRCISRGAPHFACVLLEENKA